MQRIKFVKKQHEIGDVYTFFFEKPAGFSYKAGQHGIFILPGLFRPHPFSFSSSPDETYLAFSTHLRLSSRFKRRLGGLNEGGRVYMIGPLMDFILKPGRKHVFLAQGIGITPFRSMVLAAKSHYPELSASLIHVSSTPHLFREITESSLTFSAYPSSSGEFHELLSATPTSAVFYISGSPSFITSVRQELINRGVEKSDIKADSFLGY